MRVKNLNRSELECSDSSEEREDAGDPLSLFLS